MTHPESEHADAVHADAAAVTARLRATFESGRTRPVAWRRSQLRGVGELLDAHTETFLEALRSDLGKPAFEAFGSDIAFVKGEVRFAQRQLARWMRPERVRTPATLRPAASRILREPLGVVLIVAPWNYPIQLSLGPLVGALAAGNCAVLKPSELAPHSSGLLAELLPRYVDPEAVAVVEGAAPETQALLAERFDHVFYTGGGAVGRIVMQAAANHLTPVTLELGGKSPCIVDRNVDLEVAARRIAWGKYLNAGQTCIAPDYVLVHESREAELIDALVAAIGSFYGPDPASSPDYGRIVNDRHLERLAKLLDGADVAVGGEVSAEDRYIAPTVLRNVSPDAEVMRDEIFGPILPVLPVPDIDAAIAFVNARPKPLALYLFTEDRAVENDVLERTSSGGACVNSPLLHVANPRLPFGGVGESGMGAYHGRASFETFSHRKSILKRGTRIDPKLAYPPFSSRLLALMRRLT